MVYMSETDLLHREVEFLHETVKDIRDKATSLLELLEKWPDEGDLGSTETENRFLDMSTSALMLMAQMARVDLLEELANDRPEDQE